MGARKTLLDIEAIMFEQTQRIYIHILSHPCLIIIHIHSQRHILKKAFRPGGLTLEYGRQCERWR